MSNPAEACVSCHFFTKEYRGDGNRPMISDVAKEIRDRARGGDYGWIEDHYTLSCSFGVWDEGYNFAPAKRHEVLVKTNRSGFCFFWPHRPGMLLPAARILQERSAALRETWRDRRYAIIGLWIAGIALLAEVGLKVAEAQNWWPF